MKRFFCILGLGLMLTGDYGESHPQPSSVRTPPEGKAPPAAVPDPSLFENNARFFGGRTSRWVLPIPIFVLGDVPEVSQFALEQFRVWEAVLAGTGKAPLYTLERVPNRAPYFGIYFTYRKLPDKQAGQAEFFINVAESARRGSVTVQGRAQLGSVTAVRGPEGSAILSNGEIVRCEIALDMGLRIGSGADLRAVMQHEIGHCLGFYGHVASGLMGAVCCDLVITSDVSETMRKLYSLPPGTEVSP